MQKYIGEFFGTMVLSGAVMLTLVSSSSPLATPLVAGLVLGLFVYSMGSISGTHINPAVTVGLWSIKKIKTVEALKYIVAQFLGAAISMYCIAAFIAVPNVIANTGSAVALAEFFGMLLFSFGIASVVFGKVKDAASGLVIGSSLLLGIIVAVTMGSNGVLNPAVAVAIGSANLYYLLVPLAGSVAGMWLYRYLNSGK